MTQVLLKRKARGDGSPPRSCRHSRPEGLPARRPGGYAIQLERQLKLAREAACNAVKSGPDSDWVSQVAGSAPILLRRLEDGDSLEQLTDMLHRAFSRIGAMGISCSCVSQPPEVTRQRISHGECFVALSGDLIVGTITLYAPEAASDSKHYRNVRVGTLRQLAVDPLFHGQEIGNTLLHLAETWARHRGYLWLALDTPEPANHLVDYYQHQGFRIKEIVQFAGRPYRSVVFSKSVAGRTIAHHRPTRAWWPSFPRQSNTHDDGWIGRRLTPVCEFEPSLLHRRQTSPPS